MKNFITFALFCLSFSLFSSCDSEQSRKDKAEDIVKKHLFETLPDYKSYESISFTLDTINEEWISAPGIIDLGWEYASAIDNQTQLTYQLNSLRDELSEMKHKVGMELIFGNSYHAVYHGGPQLTRLKERIENIEQKRDYNSQHIETITNQILSKYDSIPVDNVFAGWHVVNKFRANDIFGTPFITTSHYYITTDFKNIIINWDEDDETADTPVMIERVSQLIKSYRVGEPDSIQ